MKKTKECCVCGEYAGKFEQWWNRDTGYGICARCALEQKTKLDSETMKSYYGIESKHYSLEVNEIESK